MMAQPTSPKSTTIDDTGSNFIAVEESSLFNVSVTVNQSQLQAVLTNMKRQLGRHEKVISTLVEDMRGAKRDLEGLKTSVHEGMLTVKRQIESHDKQLRVAQQLADISVTTTQFNTTVFKIKEDISQVSEKMTQVEEHVAKTSKSKMEQMFGESIDKWYNDVCLVEAKERETVFRTQVQSDMMSMKLVSDLVKKVEGKANKDETKSVLETIRADVVRTRKYAQEELEKLTRLVTEFERSTERKFNDNSNDVMDRFQRASRRIATIFDLMSLSEDECALVVNDGVGTKSLDDVRTNVSGRKASFNEPPAVGGGGGQRRRTNATLSAGSGSGADDDGGDDNNSTSGAAAMLPPIEDDIDDKTALVMQSPVFLAFRHQLLRDLGDRLSSTRTAQASDFDIEMLDVRNELRQRVTTQRVIELIRQYSDTDTPQKVAALHRRMQDVEVDKVSHSYLNEALRGKGDLHVLEAKADRTMVKDMVDQTKHQVFQLHQEFQEFQRDRSEFQLLKQVLDGGVPTSGGDALLDPETSKMAAGLVKKEETALIVEKKAAESLPVVRTPQPPPTEKDVKQLVGSDTPEPTYLPSVQGIDRRSASAVQVMAEERETHSSASSREPPVRRDPSGPSRRVPSVRPLTDHRDRERTIAAISSSPIPVSVPAKASIPGVSSIKGAAPKVEQSQIQQKVIPTATAYHTHTSENVVPMTTSQRAYAQFVSERVVADDVESSPVPAYRDLKPRQVPTMYDQ